jgi:uncharacterized protein
MAVVVDTTVVIALMASAHPRHAAVRDWIAALDDDLVTTPLALADMDRLATELGGAEGSAALRADLDAGAYLVRWWADALGETVRLATARPALTLTQASLVALAARLGTRRLATLDHDTFRHEATASGDPFVLLPAEAA